MEARPLHEGSSARREGMAVAGILLNGVVLVAFPILALLSNVGFGM